MQKISKGQSADSELLQRAQTYTNGMCVSQSFLTAQGPSQMKRVEISCELEVREDYRETMSLDKTGMLYSGTQGSCASLESIKPVSILTWSRKGS